MRTSLMAGLVAGALAFGAGAQEGSEPPKDWEAFCKRMPSSDAEARCGAALRRRLGIARCDLDGPLWEVSRQVDAITDVRTCSVGLADPAWARRGGVRFAVANGAPYFAVTGELFPGKESALRVDDNRAYVFGEVLIGADAEALLREIDQGQMLTTRHIEWPSGTPVTLKHPVCDLPEKLRACSAPE